MSGSGHHALSMINIFLIILVFNDVRLLFMGICVQEQLLLKNIQKRDISVHSYYMSNSKQ